jgi:hypothetical protein
MTKYLFDKFNLFLFFILFSITGYKCVYGIINGTESFKKRTNDQDWYVSLNALTYVFVVECGGEQMRNLRTSRLL